MSNSQLYIYLYINKYIYLYKNSQLYIYIYIYIYKHLHPERHKKYVHSFAQASIAKYQRLNDLNKRNLFSYKSEDWKSEIRLLVEFIFSKTSPWLVDG